MTKDTRIKAFVGLGKYFASLPEELVSTIHTASVKNKWFTETNCKRAIIAIADEFLNEDKLNDWLGNYEIDDNDSQLVIGIVAAGNIPLVTFHDILTVLISGHHLKIKLSDKGSILTSFILNKLIQIEPAFEPKINIIERLTDFDAVIATGSNNSARYFEYYFGKYPSIIRKNRNSIAVLNGKENLEELIALADDIFAYFGLGCRNVSKIYVPKDYDFELFNKAISDYKILMDHYHYRNNLDYNRTLLMMNLVPMLDIDFINVVEHKMIASPISNLHYEYYDLLDSVKQEIEIEKEDIQCIVSNISEINGVTFGKSQQPSLSDYADNVDTMAFLQGLA